MIGEETSLCTLRSWLIQSGVRILLLLDDHDNDDNNDDQSSHTSQNDTNDHSDIAATTTLGSCVDREGMKGDPK